MSYIFSLILSLLSLCSAQTKGLIQLYSDGDCTVNNTAPVPLFAEVCFALNQKASISALLFPSCENGTPTLFITDRDGCKKPTVEPGPSSNTLGSCLSLLSGLEIGSAAFQCVGAVTTVSNSPASTSSTRGQTAQSSEVISTSKSSDPPGTTATPPMSTVSDSTTSPMSGSSTSSKTSSGSSQASAPAQSSSSSSSSGGLGLADKIGIISTAVAIASLFVGSLAWWYTRAQALDTARHPPVRLVYDPDQPPPYEFRPRRT